MRIRKHGPVDDLLQDDEILAAAKVADALAHPARIRILRYIITENVARRPVANKTLVREFDYAQATISQHISKLIIGGLIEVQKRGVSSNYFAKIGKLSAYTETLKKIESPPSVDDMPDFLKPNPEPPEADKPVSTTTESEEIVAADSVVPVTSAGGDFAPAVENATPGAETIPPEDDSDMPGFLRTGYYDADDIVAELSGYPDSDYSDDASEGEGDEDFGAGVKFL